MPWDNPHNPQPSGGILGRAEGLIGQGLGFIQHQQNFNTEQQNKQKQLDLQAMEHGLIKGKDGTYEYQPQVKQQKYQQEMSSDPDTDESEVKRQMAYGIVKQFNPDAASQIHAVDEDGNKVVSGDAADALVKQYTPMMGFAAKQANFNEKQNQNSVQAGHAFESDPIIKASKVSTNSLNRSSSILTNPNKPVTTKDLNLAYNDYMNAVAAGGQATEGKIARELPDTWEQSWNDFKAKGGRFDDIRKDETGKKLVSMLAENIATVQRDLHNAVSEQAHNIYQNYGSSSNPKVKEIAKNKLKSYSPEHFSEIFPGESEQTSEQKSGQGLIQQHTGLVPPQAMAAPGTEDQQAVEWAKSNPNDVRAQKILKLHGM